MSDSGSGSSRNPFARREEFSSQSILLYKISTGLSYLILLVTAFYYTFNQPNEGHGPHHRFWQGQPPTPFAQNSIITSIYWYLIPPPHPTLSNHSTTNPPSLLRLILFALQLVYAYSLWSSSQTYLLAAANIGTHYITSNLLLFGFIHLWVRSHFWLAELLLIINFFNLSFAYFRHSTTPRLIHIGTVAGPLAWNFVALYWVGAVAFHSTHIVGRIVANVFIWGWLGYGVFFLAAYKDYTMGFALSVLAFCKFSSRVALLLVLFVGWS